MNNKHQKDRNQEIYKKRKQGISLRKLGVEYGVTDTRIDQICKSIEREMLAEATRPKRTKKDIDKMVELINKERGIK